MELTVCLCFPGRESFLCNMDMFSLAFAKYAMMDVFFEVH